MLRIALFLLCAVQLLQAHEADVIDFCTTKYVKPGDDIRLTCSTSHGVEVQMLTPIEDVPSHDEFVATGNVYRQAAGDTAESHDGSWMDFQNVNKADHAGWYTCVVYYSVAYGYHGSGYTTARCEVIIEDLCEGVVCRTDTVCVGDYSTGGHSCVCDVVCDPYEFDMLCADDCSFHISPCRMRQKSCEDNVNRTVMNMGPCPNPLVAPVVNQLLLPETYKVFAGESITLSSGVVSDGVPSAQVTWTFVPSNSDESSELPIEDPVMFITAALASSGTYIAEVKYCANTVGGNTYNVEVLPPITADPGDFGTSSPTPTASETPNINILTGHVCSAFPGGVIETFSGEGTWYDLACTHVLAADIMAGGDYTNPWYIYGTFDQHEGGTSLAAMTFYVGSSTFEFQRGWVINVDGSKFEIEENVSREIGGGCNVVYRDLHLQVTCEHFEAYYDGIMSGHIRLIYIDLSDSSGVPEKGNGNFGLCYDGDSGWRKNWQVGPTEGHCTVSTDDHSCESTSTDCAEYSQTSLGKKKGYAPFTWCEAGPTQSCIEINCGDETASEVQTCALQQAARVMCALRYANPLGGSDDKCPEDECEWKKDLLSRGCPQPNPPFVCL